MNQPDLQTTSTEDSGILMFAYNNDQIDYVRLALLAALSAKKYMKNNSVALMTDVGTVAWMEQSLPKDLVTKAFDHIIVDNIEHEKNINLRKYKNALVNLFKESENN